MARTKTTFTKKTASDAGKNAHSPEQERKRNETKKVNRLVKGAVYDELRKAFLEPNGNKTPFYQDFIKKIVAEAKKDPNSPIGRMIAEQLFQQDILTALDAQTEKYLAKDRDFIEYRLLKQLFDKQRDVFLDNFTRKRSIMCSRRAGKTELNPRMMIKACATPGTPCLYVNLTFTNAIRQCFDNCIDIAKAIEMPITRSSKNEGFIEFANGSSIVFRGNSNRSEADKIRGYKYRLVVIDEAGHQVNMEYLIEEVIQPLLMDFEDSVLILTGTPPRRKGTYFENTYLSKEWKQYHWTMLDNPFIKNAEQEIENIAKSKGLTVDSPFIQREYFGQIAYDTEAQVFKGFQTYKEVPPDFVPTHIYEGVDFGFTDFNGVVTLAANIQTRQAFTIYERKFNKATITEIVDVIREGFEAGKKFLIERNQNADLSNVSIYTDNNEKSITYELATTYGLPAYCAYKYNRDMAIAQLAEETRTGRLKVMADNPLQDEFERTLYKRDDQDNITSELDDSFHPDISMALLYASRQYFYDCGMDVGGESGNKQNGTF